MPLDRHRTTPVPSPYDEVQDVVEPWDGPEWVDGTPPFFGLDRTAEPEVFKRDPEPPPSWWSRLWGWVYRRLA